MAHTERNFSHTWLWREAFETPRSDSLANEQEFFKAQFLEIRERTTHLVAQIAVDMPGFTVHDISHLDALWETASSVAEDVVDLNPAEAFVFGASVLLHDSAMSLSAYPGGLSEVKETLAWRDTVALRALEAEESGKELFDCSNPPEEIVKEVVPDVLRQLHAEQAEVLAEQVWRDGDGSEVHLIENSDVRTFYGPTIGQIAHSHWWPVSRLEQEFPEKLGGFPNRTDNCVDQILIACLLRVADALHLDGRRAPRFLRAITNPSGISAIHWAFQERLARPRIDGDAVVFTSGQPFGLEDAEAWWLAYDTINAVDRELREVDLLLQGRGSGTLKARRVKGATSPESLARSIKAKNWRPVSARLHVSDVHGIVKHLGGAKLYGDNPTVALRELIQNSVDAVEARRKCEIREPDWGKIRIEILERANEWWLAVEDNGIGMSEIIMTGPLLDFGKSFWRSPLATQEFPGLMAEGMRAIGRFGIGFFSVFMLGTVVRVYSRRFDKEKKSGRLLEFRDGTTARPMLSSVSGTPMPIDGGTRVEVKLSVNPKEEGGLLDVASLFRRTITLEGLVGAVAPNLNVNVEVKDDTETRTVARARDWLRLDGADLLCRVSPTLDAEKSKVVQLSKSLLQQATNGDGVVVGRAFIWPEEYSFSSEGGWITISGLSAAPLRNVKGILLGEALTASRDSAKPLVGDKALRQWATKQAELIASIVKGGEHQARSAEVVLECGGEIRDLKIVRWGSEWLSEKEFEEELVNSTQLAISFDGEFTYDESVDEVHPREFEYEFSWAEDVAVVLKHNGSILNLGASSWPRTLSGRQRAGDSNVAEYVRAVVKRVWGEDVEMDEEQFVVGTVMTGLVSSVDIWRQVATFRKVDEEEL